MIRLAIVLLLAAPCWSQDILGVKIYYSDKVVRIAASAMPQGWIKAPADDVQVVLIYQNRQQDGKYLPDEMSGYDFYWWSPSKGFGQGNELEAIPKDANYKRGKWMYPDSAFLKLYNKAHGDHQW